MTADNTPPSEPNDVHAVNYPEIYELASSLPPGWIRRDDSPRQAPFLHVESGRCSWKHPNLQKILDAKKIMDAGKRKQPLDGVDISAVLSPRADGQGEPTQETSVPETLRKKYKRMIKAGVPMDRVCQLAGVEAGLSQEAAMALFGTNQPAKVEEDATDGESADGRADKVIPAKQDPKMVKFQRMHKAGIPMAAIRNAAHLQGCTSKELHAALGIEMDDSEGGGLMR
eukprot:CCRYP_010666-RC/>CCRYP_010666-RC protein AED:0.42 eAED:0.43 QI:0/0/0/1/1/1/2/0/226